MLALQTRQQLSSTALSLASQADQAPLRLFQSSQAIHDERTAGLSGSAVFYLGADPSRQRDPSCGFEMTAVTRRASNIYGRDNSLRKTTD